MQRQAEILAKKSKLAELKRQRELRQKEFSASRQSIGAATDLLKTSSPSRTESKEDLDNLISRLVGDDARTPVTPRTPSSQGRSRPGSYVSPANASDDVVENKQASPGAIQSQVASSGTQTLSLAEVKTVYETRAEEPRKEVLTYSKAVQTSPQSRSRSRSASTESEDSIAGERSSRRRLSKRDKERKETLRQNIRKEIEEELNAVKQLNVEIESISGKQNFPARALTQEEKDAVTGSNDFLDFVERSSKVIERALDEEYDVLADYRAGNLTGLDDDDEEIGATGRRGRRVREVMQFYDERWSKRRIISDIGFSPKFPELILSAHTKNASSPYDPPGIVQVWNTHMHSRPEYIFHANSDLLTAKFSPFHPNYILGGTYSGQVLLWDTRSSSAQPMQKTPLTGTGFGHTHPIYSLNIVGTQNAHNIISTSTDGVVCSWSIDMLSHPQEYLELATPPPQSQNGTSTSSSTIPGITPYNIPTTLSPLTTAFPPTDPSYFLAGTEAGPIHLVHRYDRAGSKAGVDASTTFSGHAAPVMSLDFHKASGPLDLGDLLLSTSLDWSVRLWRVRTPGSLGANAFTGVEQERRRREVRPLVTWQRDEPVYDAKWSPTRPGVWASVDGAGFLEVWDLNYEVEAPVTRVVPTQRDGIRQGLPAPAPGVGGGRSLNKCAWEPGEGKRIAVGGLDGVVSVFEVGGELGGVEGLRQEEWMGVKKLVTRLEGDGR